MKGNLQTLKKKFNEFMDNIGFECIKTKAYEESFQYFLYNKKDYIVLDVDYTTQTFELEFYEVEEAKSTILLRGFISTMIIELVLYEIVIHKERWSQ